MKRILILTMSMPRAWYHHVTSCLSWDFIINFKYLSIISGSLVLLQELGNVHSTINSIQTKVYCLLSTLSSVLCAVSNCSLRYFTVCGVQCTVDCAPWLVSDLTSWGSTRLAAWPHWPGPRVYDLHITWIYLWQKLCYQDELGDFDLCGIILGMEIVIGYFDDLNF